MVVSDNKCTDKQPGSVPFGIHLARQGRDKGTTLAVCKRLSVNQRTAWMNYTVEELSPEKDNSSVSIYKQLAHSAGQHKQLLCPYF